MPKTNGHFSTLSETIKALQGLPDQLVHFDVFHNKIFSVTGQEWSDRDTLLLTANLQELIGMKVSDEMVYKAVQVVAWHNRTNEPKDWMGTLVWDGKDRIREFFTICFGADDSGYTHAVSQNFWIGMIARVYDPGCLMRNMVVLEGTQNIGKTRGLKTIGGPWYAELQMSVESKDFLLGIQGKLLVELAELGAFHKRVDVERIKQAISCPVDRFRIPYERSAQDHPRQCVFVGTTNEETYLRDDTGGSRFWPVKCGAIEIGLIEEMRNQCFAEAVIRYRTGTPYWIVPTDAAHEQEARRIEHPWETIIAQWLIGRVEVMVLDVLRDGLNLPIRDQSKATQMTVAAILKGLGWKRRSVRVAGKPQWVWHLPQL